MGWTMFVGLPLILNVIIIIIIILVLRLVSERRQEEEITGKSHSTPGLWKDFKQATRVFPCTSERRRKWENGTKQTKTITELSAKN